MDVTEQMKCKEKNVWVFTVRLTITIEERTKERRNKTMKRKRSSSNGKKDTRKREWKFRPFEDLR